MDWQKVSEAPEEVPTPLQQHAYYGRTCALLGAEVSRYIVGDTSNPLGQAQVISRRFPLIGPVAQILRGPIWMRRVSCGETAEMANGLIRQLRRTHRAVVTIGEPVRGGDPLESAPILPVLGRSAQARLMLDGSEEARLQRQHGKWRNRLRRAMDSELKVEQSGLPSDPGHWLLRNEDEQAKRRGYRGMPSGFSLAWRHANGVRSTRLFVARQNREAVAAIFLLCHGKAATYQIGWTNDDGRKSHAHNLLIWEAANWCARRGMAWLDLGILDTETTPGLARFKLGSGATPINLGATRLDAFGTRMVARLFQPMVRDSIKSRQSLPMRG